MALIPLVTLMLAGNDIVRSTSYMTVPGKILGSLLVVFLPSTVSPKIDVISLPAYENPILFRRDARKWEFPPNLRYMN
jgi:hypothetical protein